jgi:hypothetical protein
MYAEYRAEKARSVDLDDEGHCTECQTPLNNAVSYKNSNLCVKCFYDA